jgi:L-threonylcarbamoyladenylate synthase
VPAHPVALALLRASRVPLAAPSANRSTELSPTAAEHVLRSLDGRIDMVLDAGPTTGGIESTVLDLTTDPPRLLRPGLVSPAEIEAVIGRIQTLSQTAAETGSPGRSPGLMQKHYAPRAPLELADGDGRVRVEALTRDGRRVGWLSRRGEDDVPGVVRIEMPTEPSKYAAQLYAALHELDASGVERIVVERPPEGEEWMAIHDRLRRAESV